jgi:hypothetical protein
MEKGTQKTEGVTRAREDFGTKWLMAQGRGGAEPDITSLQEQTHTLLKKVVNIETTSGDRADREISS